LLAIKVGPYSLLLPALLLLAGTNEQHGVAASMRMLGRWKAFMDNEKHRSEEMRADMLYLFW
jgi:hypothetical protein